MNATLHRTVASKLEDPGYHPGIEVEHLQNALVKAKEHLEEAIRTATREDTREKLQSARITFGRAERIGSTALTSWFNTARNPNLSDTGKIAKNKEISKAFNTNWEDAYEELSGIIDRVQSKNGMTPAYPEGWPDGEDANSIAARETILGNARTDARMSLDAYEPHELTTRMAELAEHGEPHVRYLLLATPWAASYLRSRGGNRLPHRLLSWDKYRQELEHLVYAKSNQERIKDAQATRKHLAAARSALSESGGRIKRHVDLAAQQAHINRIDYGF